MEPDLELKRWTRKEFEQLVERGVFTRTDRIELIDGLLTVAEPQSAYHYGTLRFVAHALAQAFGAGWDIRMEAPVSLDDNSVPEPDVAVVRGDFRDYVREHPSEPVLVVEVALTSLALDRRHKSSLYARAGRQEYWIVDLVNRRVEVRRQPAVSTTMPYGWDYSQVQVLRTGDSVSPLAAPDARIAVGDLLPEI